jgi:hypothetical protein
MSSRSTASPDAGAAALSRRQPRDHLSVIDWRIVIAETALDGGGLPLPRLVTSSREGAAQQSSESSTAAMLVAGAAAKLAAAGVESDVLVEEVSPDADVDELSSELAAGAVLVPGNSTGSSPCATRSALYAASCSCSDFAG